MTSSARLRRLAQVAVAGTLLMSLGVAQAAEPASTVQVNPTSPSAVGLPLLILAGSPGWLLFQQTDPPAWPPVGPVMARSADGTITTLPDTERDDQWNLAGHVVIGSRRFAAGAVDWWDLTSGRHGSVELGTTRSLIGAAPNGINYISHGRLHRLVVATGRRRDYRRVADLKHGFSIPTGMVLKTSRGWRYLRYAKPSRLRPIHLPSSSDNPTKCQASSAHYLACSRGYVDDDALAPSVDLLIPLDGGRPTATRHCPGFPTVTGDTMVWAAASTSFNAEAGCDMNSPAVSLLRAGSSTIRHLSTQVTSPDPFADAFDAAASYGKAVFTGLDMDSLVTIDADGNAETIYTSDPAPVHVAEFAMSAGRVVDADTAQDPARPDRPLSIWAHPTTGDGQTVSVGDGSVIDDGWADRMTMAFAHLPGEHAIASSGSTLAYFVDDASAGVDLRVVTPLTATTIGQVDPQVLQVSGNRVLYRDANTPHGHDYRLLDLRTGQTADLTTLHPKALAFDLWGDYLLYDVNARRIYRENLSNGTRTLVADQYSAEAEEYGDYVLLADSSRDLTLINAVTGARSTVREGKTSTATYLDGPHLTSAGVVYATPARWHLSRWDGTKLPLVDIDDIRRFDYPVIEGRAFAWIDTDADLQVAAIDVPLPAPRSLGDPVAPETFTADGSHTWQTSIPYSQPLTSCTVTISNGSSDIRTLACDSSMASLGVAAVAWDGRAADGRHVASGRYTWTAHASGQGGDALDPAGSPQPVTGSIDVE